MSICHHDGCPAEICGGPHYEVETDLGLEVLKKGQSPIGKPISEMTDEQRAAHEEAVDNSIGERKLT